MPESVSAQFDGKVIIPDQPLAYPKGQRLRVKIEAVAPPPIAELLKKVPELEERDGVVFVRGTRIGVNLIFEELEQSVNADEIHLHFPDISRALLERINEYYRDNEIAIRQYVESIRETRAQICSEEHQGPSLQELRDRRPATS